MGNCGVVVIDEVSHKSAKDPRKHRPTKETGPVEPIGEWVLESA